MKMEKKVKNWIEAEYGACVMNDSQNVTKAIDRCYGILMFAANTLFKDYNEELGKWWDDEMLPKFRELERRR